MQWFRWHRGTSANPKFAVIANEADKPTDAGEGNRCYGAVTVTDVVAVWAVMLEYAASDDQWGVCEKDHNFIATVLRWWPDEVKSVIGSLEKHGLIESNGDGYSIVNWNKYQYVSDKDPTNAERQRRYRNKSKTLTKRTRNALPKRPETETETETELTPSAANAASPPRETAKHCQKPNGKTDGRPKGARLDPDWEPGEEDRAYAAGRGFSPGEISDMAASFKAHFTQGNGRNKTWKKWPGADGAWGNWVRRETARGGRNNDAGGDRPGNGGVVAVVNRIIDQGKAV